MPSHPLPAEPFVPHRPPMLLVDFVLAHDAHSIQTRCCVRDLPPFGTGDGRVPATIGLEMMAQSVAALSGLRRHALGLAPSIGLLVGSRRYRSQTSHFQQGHALTVNATEKLSDYVDMNVFACEIRDADDQLLAEGDLKAYLPEDIHAYLEAHP